MAIKNSDAILRLFGGQKYLLYSIHHQQVNKKIIIKKNIYEHCGSFTLHNHQKYPIGLSSTNGDTLYICICGPRTKIKIKIKNYYTSHFQVTKIFLKIFN